MPSLLLDQIHNIFWKKSENIFLIWGKEISILKMFMLSSNSFFILNFMPFMPRCIAEEICIPCGSVPGWLHSGQMSADAFLGQTCAQIVVQKFFLCNYFPIADLLPPAVSTSLHRKAYPKLFITTSFVSQKHEKDPIQKWHEELHGSKNPETIGNNLTNYWE